MTRQEITNSLLQSSLYEIPRSKNELQKSIETFIDL